MKRHQLPSTCKDSIFLAACVVLSAVFYVANLGFYSDDWALLAKLNSAATCSIADLFSSLYEPWTAMRPAQLLYFVLLYRWFGAQPLGYHLVNLSVLVCMVVFFYLSLRRLYLARAMAVAISLVFAVLPHYSSNRLWFAAFGNTLSMALYFVSLYTALRAVTATNRLRWHNWMFASGLALLISGLCYEVPLPFFLLSAVVIWRLRATLARSNPGQPAIRMRDVTAIFLTVVSVFAVAAFKLSTTVRLGAGDGGVLQSMLGIVRRAFVTGTLPGAYGLNIEQAIRTNFTDFVIGLPALWLRAGSDRLEALTLVPALVTALAVWKYFLTADLWEDGARDSALSRRTSSGLVVLGFGAFWLGYAIFLTNSNLQFTLTGIGNRANIGAAVGVAPILIGMAVGVGGLFRSALHGRHVFAFCLATLCASGVLANNVIAYDWVRAYEQEQAILANIRSNLPVPPTRSTLILDGICSYVGPAIVFDSNWDLRGALRLLYRDFSLNADVVTSRMTLESTGLTTTQYGKMYHYPFDQSLFVYDYESQKVYPLSDFVIARRYFDTRNIRRNRPCPPGLEGLGAAAW